MARKHGKSGSDPNAPGSLNKRNEKAWTKYLEEHLLVGRVRARRFASCSPPSKPRHSTRSPVARRSFLRGDRIGELMSAHGHFSDFGEMSDLSPQVGQSGH